MTENMILDASDVSSITDKASIDGVEGGKTPAAQQCGLENPSTKVPEGASCR